MSVTLVVVIGAVLAGLLRGGSLGNLSRLELPGWPLVIAALACQVLGAYAGSFSFAAPGAFYVVGMLASAVLVAVFVARNRWLPGMPLIAIGFLLNAVVVTANGAMPVDPAAVERVGFSPDSLYEGTDSKHEVLDEQSRLRPLTDIVAVPLPGPLRRGSNVVSVGDIVLAAGIGVLVLNGMLRPGPGRRARQAARGGARADPTSGAPG